MKLRIRLVRQGELAPRRRFAQAVRKDPDVIGFAMSAGSTTFNTGQFFIALKPKDEGRTTNADEVIARLSLDFQTDQLQLKRLK